MSLILSEAAFVSVTKASRFLSKTPFVIRNMIDRGELRAVRGKPSPNGKHQAWRIELSSIEEWLTMGANKPLKALQQLSISNKE